MSVCATCLKPGLPADGKHDCPGLGDIQLTRQLGRGVRVDTAPPRARMALTVLADHGYGLAMQGTDLISIADQVLYQIVGYDPESAALVLELVEDWRPNSPVPGFAPARPVAQSWGEPSGDPLVVEPYRNDRGESAWVFRCWGTDTCDGWLSLDHHSQESAERARDRHVAEEHGDAPAADPDGALPWSELRTSGLLWLINRVAFHPRGVALTIHATGDTVHGWSLTRTLGGEPWQFDDATDAGGHTRAEATLASALNPGKEQQ